MRLRAEICWHAYRFPELFCPGTLGELVGVSGKTARKHLRRFEESIDALEACVAEGNRSKLERLIEDCLQDAPRTGRRPNFSPLQIVSIISIACEKPELSGRPISKWTSREIADEAVKRQIVSAISTSHVARIQDQGLVFHHRERQRGIRPASPAGVRRLPAGAAKLRTSRRSYGLRG